MAQSLDSLIPAKLLEPLRLRARATGLSEQECLQQALRQYLQRQDGHHTLFVSAPVNALLEGIYQEDTTIGDIREKGDFGLGTFNDLDGEMLVVDGVVYQLRSDGRAYAVDDGTRTPFACVTFFAPDSSEVIDRPLGHAELIELLDRMVPSRNMVYAIRIDGEFEYVRTRSVPRQESYRPLVEVTREQPTFELRDQPGVMTGFWTPEFMSSLAVPGYHLHFLDGARSSGGHLLESRSRRITIGLQHIPRLEVGLPVTLDYLTADFTRKVDEDLEEAEH